MNIKTLKKAIELTETKVDFRCTRYKGRKLGKECLECVDFKYCCGAENVTWNCDHTLKLFEQSLNELEVINKEPYLDYIKIHGGFCDCEVIFNVKPNFEYERQSQILEAS